MKNYYTKLYTYCLYSLAGMHAYALHKHKHIPYYDLFNICILPYEADLINKGVRPALHVYLITSRLSPLVIYCKKYVKFSLDNQMKLFDIARVNVYNENVNINNYNVYKSYKRRRL